jgi:exopolysaccharide biosynthesis polyprenyl glycosylphosphotransferase
VREKDTTEALLSALAVVFDAIAVCGGFMLATWLRMDSGWVPVAKSPPANYVFLYAQAAAVITGLMLIVLRTEGLYVRPQTGSFVNKIPRIVKSSAAGIVMAMVLAFALQNEREISRMVIALAALTITFFLLLERYILFRIEWNLARHRPGRNRVLILGTDSVAAHLRRTLRREHMLRSEIIGFLETDQSDPDPEIPTDLLIGNMGNIENIVEEKKPDQIIITGASIERDRLFDVVLLCERHLIEFGMVPDLFRLMTASMDVQALDDIPLLGLRHWPLENFWNRVLKRGQDLCGALIFLVVAAPVITLAAIIIKITSPGPVFYRQERCGEKGARFQLYKLRTMHVDAESETGPVFTAADDSRRTSFGTTLRKYNIDELPQLWNVLRGDMSLVGPRPERPHFVEQFRTNVARYMWRHVSKPGMTGWAQVNGLRGDTSIEERVKYDLYYLENWSLAFDFKILVKTLAARQNAY